MHNALRSSLATTYAMACRSSRLPNLVVLRRQLNETQQGLGKQFGVSRQTVANWEDGVRKPHPSKLRVFAKLAAKIISRADGPPVRKSDFLTVAQSAAYLHVAEKTIRNAIEDGHLAYVRDTMAGPWPKNGRYLMTRTDLDAFKTKAYDPYFKKGRWVRGEPARGTGCCCSCVSRTSPRRSDGASDVTQLKAIRRLPLTRAGTGNGHQFSICAAFPRVRGLASDVKPGSARTAGLR